MSQAHWETKMKEIASKNEYFASYHAKNIIRTLRKCEKMGASNITIVNEDSIRLHLSPGKNHTKLLLFIFIQSKIRSADYNFNTKTNNLSLYFW